MTQELLTLLQSEGQDHEFYPTTDEIIKALIKDLSHRYDERKYSRNHGQDSMLDIGAGNGKVLKAIYEAETGIKELFAIEKSSILCQQLDPTILIVGTEFEQQTLFSKPVSVVFSNPPYSVYELWADKIIRQAACGLVYLVIPQRWERSTIIADALKWRGVKETKIIGSFDFEDSEDRTARAKVHLLRLQMPESDDAFERFFEQEFAGLYEKFKSHDQKSRSGDEEDAKPKESKFSALVLGPSFPEALVSLYDTELANVRKNYQLVSQLDAGLLKEFDMNPQRIMECLKSRLKGLKNEYWAELFGRLDKITSRLTSKSRNALLTTLNKHTEVDFTLSNIMAVVIWVINNANQYLESQLIETYEVMVEKCNVKLYKSNKRVWEDDRWRYNGDREKHTHYALDYRIVTHQVGGIRFGYNFDREKVGLEDSAGEFLGDLITIANNLGFTCDDSQRRIIHYGTGYKGNWSAGQSYDFYTQSGEKLMDVRAFKNRNLHLRLNQDFICALNVEHGRLKRWINTPQEAVDELQDPKAAQYFNRNHRLELNPKLLLCA